MVSWALSGEPRVALGCPWELDLTATPAPTLDLLEASPARGALSGPESQQRAPLARLGTRREPQSLFRAGGATFLGSGSRRSYTPIPPGLKK